MIDPRRPDYALTPASKDRPAFGYAPAKPVGADVRPVVSVITPFYNVNEVFLETARCVLGQSLQQIEWIIINDASTDPASLALLEPFRAMEREFDRPGVRVRVIDHQKNLGLAATRNTGYRHALSDLVFQIDADDLMEPTTLEKCAWRLHSRPHESFVKGKTVGFAGDRYLWDRGFHEGRAFVDENLATATAMVRRSAWKAVGGFDETIRGGMEDWDFWLRLAEHGHWGGTINEYLDWYRRRDNQHADWHNLASSRGLERFRAHLRHACPRVCSGWFPPTEGGWHMPMESVRDEPPFANLLTKSRKRLLMVIPWMRMGGADRFNLDLTRTLTTVGDDRTGPWEVTIATTMWGEESAYAPVGAGNEWFAEFARLTPDYFLSHNYLRMPDAPVFLEYLIRSRRPDVVLITNSRLGYQVLPFLRERCPEPVYLDFNHMEEPWWKNGGHPRTGVGYQEQLDLSVTVSRHLKDWMEERGAKEKRIEVCYINADTQRWRPEPAWRNAVRNENGIADGTPVVLYAARLCAQKQPLVFADVIRRVRDLLEPDWRRRLDEFERAHGTYDDRRRAHERAWKDWHDERDRRGIRGDLPPDELRAMLPMPAPMERPPGRFVALVAGDGELLGATRAYCDAHDLVRSGHVVFAGAVTTEAMPGYMAASDVFFLPSRWEGIALSIYEAMAAGLAVLGADVGGQRELVHEGTGVLMPGPDECGSAELEAQGYAYALAGLVINPARRAALGAAARERITRHFELDHMRRRMLEIFDRAAELQERDPRDTLTPGLARELAQQAVEFARMDALNEELWPYKARCDEADRVARDLAAAQSAQAAAARELAEIEASRAWRAIQTIKTLPPYRAYARLRWGAAALADWQRIEVKKSPQERLGAIRASRSFRLIQSVKSSAPYALYTRLKQPSRHRGS